MLIGMSLLLVLGLYGQEVTLLRARIMPMDGMEGNLFLEEETGLLYQYRSEGWEAFRNERVDSIVACEGYWVVSVDGGQYLINAEGQQASAFPIVAYCGAEGLLFRSQGAWQLVVEGKVPKEVVTSYDQITGTSQYAMYVQGRVGHSAWAGAEVASGIRFSWQLNAVGWGIKDLAGNWLIEPLYDAPFWFQDGKAEVARYGERFWINESGARIE